MVGTIPLKTVDEFFDPTARIKSRPFQMMAEAVAGLQNPLLDSFRKEGGKVLGFLCSMAPEELLMAAGCLGYRMRGTGSTNTDLADNYFTALNCGFPRHVLNLGIEGEFDFLDGIVYLNSCDHIRRLYDNWKREVPTEFIELLTMPKTTGDDQVRWFTEEFQLLRGKLEQHFGVEITDEKLRVCIQVLNETRGLQRELYMLRKQDNPPITGAEALTVMVAGTAMPKAAYNELLRELIDEFRDQRGTGREYRARLMVTGGILDDPRWINVIEEIGGLVVVDGLCFGSRMMWESVDETIEDPIEALGRYYLTDQPGCPRMVDRQDERAKFTETLAREFRVDGIVSAKMVFCDQWNVENYMLKSDMAALGLPFLSVEREYITSGTGQLKTRIQAFIESMGK